MTAECGHSVIAKCYFIPTQVHLVHMEAKAADSDSEESVIIPHVTQDSKQNWCALLFKGVVGRVLAYTRFDISGVGGMLADIRFARQTDSHFLQTLITHWLLKISLMLHP